MGSEREEEETPSTESKLADLSKVLKGIRGDEVLLGRLIGNFLDDCPARRSALHRAVVAGDREGVDREAHGLRGSLLLFGAEPAARLVSELEVLARDGRLQRAEETLRLLDTELEQLTEFLSRRRAPAP
ncbi:MAG: Hpt domain-containing protein [Deltaproteobacteria bacterium]|nr:Hpt domain-containing protein [Deltaproteobacteria bacterium]